MEVGVCVDVDDVHEEEGVWVAWCWVLVGEMILETVADELVYVSLVLWNGWVWVSSVQNSDDNTTRLISTLHIPRTCPTRADLVMTAERGVKLTSASWVRDPVRGLRALTTAWTKSSFSLGPMFEML